MATGDRGGRVVLFERVDVNDVSLALHGPLAVPLTLDLGGPHFALSRGVGGKWRNPMCPPSAK